MPTVRGKSEVQAFMARIPGQMNDVLRGAARAGARIVADEIKATTPSDAVREAVRIRTQVGDDQVRVKIDVKPGWALSLGVWLEYGTSPHFISVDDSQRGGRSINRINRLADTEGASLVIGGNFVGQTVWHPGARAHPTFRPALDKKESEAIAAAQAYVRTRVTRAGIIGRSGKDDE